MLSSDKTSSPRPSPSDPEVLRAAVRVHLDRIVAYIDSEDEREEVEDQVVEALERSSDGYEMCSYLEQRHGWSPDSGLVEMMDRTAYEVRGVHRAAVKSWVAAVGLTPTFKFGDAVRWRRRAPFGVSSETVGEVVNVDIEVAQYRVYSKDLGHVRPGSGKSGATAAIVNFEDATVLL